LSQCSPHLAFKVSDGELGNGPLEVLFFELTVLIDLASIQMTFNDTQ